MVLAPAAVTSVQLAVPSPQDIIRAPAEFKVAASARDLLSFLLSMLPAALPCGPVCQKYLSIPF